MSLILPSYQSGFAPRDYEPAYPSLWQGCVAAYAPLLGPTGLVLRDAAGKNDGVLTNGPTWDISGGRYALGFDGTDDYVTVSRRPVFDITRVRTVSAWIKATTFDGQFGYNDIALCDFIGGTREWVFATYTNDGNASTAKLIFIMFGTSGGSAEADTTAEVLESNKWLHVCAVNDGSYTFGGISLYVNGVKYATTDLSTGTFGSPNVSATNAFQIGRRVGNSGFDLHWNGQIDDVRLYHRQLSESEIKLLSSRRGIGYDYKTHRSYSKTQSSGLLKRLILTGQT